MQADTNKFGFIEKTIKARMRCAELAKEAECLGLTTLANEWTNISRRLQRAIETQLQIFRKNKETDLLAHRLESFLDGRG